MEYRIRFQGNGGYRVEKKDCYTGLWYPLGERFTSLTLDQAKGRLRKLIGEFEMEKVKILGLAGA